MFVFYILLYVNIKENEPPVTQPGKQREHHFEGKSQVIDERVTHKINERGPGIIGA
jgi:hypothetical protein